MCTMEMGSLKKCQFYLHLLCISLLAKYTHSHGFIGPGSRFGKFIARDLPEQIHIAFGATAQDIVIMWATKKNEKMQVEVVKADNDIQKFQAQTVVLGDESDHAAQYIHRAYLSDLTPEEMYGYRIVGDSGSNSNMYYFVVPTTVPKRVHSFMIFADLGLLSKNMTFLTFEARTRKYEAVFHVGDIAYDLHRDKGMFGDIFMKHMEKFAAEVPYMTVPGDHERFMDYVHYRYRFSMPGSAWPMPVDRLWYSIDIGPVHFVAINTEVFYELQEHQEKQLRWLRADLLKANTDREKHPWIIVLGHRPIYCSHTETSDRFDPDCTDDKTPSIRSQLEDLFFEKGVDLYISGHQHNYERSWPMHRGKAFQGGYKNPKAPVYIINGAMGFEYLTETFSKKKTSPWSAFRLADSNKELYGKLEVLNSSHLMWDVYAAANNEHEDSILIVKQKRGSFGTAGDGAYENLVKLQKLPPAPFEWKPPKDANSWPGSQSFYSLPTDTRRFYLLSLCCSLLTIIVCLLAIPRFRKKILRW